MAREKKTSTSAPEMKKERKVLEFNTVELEEEAPKKRRPFGLIIFLLVVILIAVGAGVYMNRTTYYNDYLLSYFLKTHSDFPSCYYTIFSFFLCSTPFTTPFY